MEIDENLLNIYERNDTSYNKIFKNMITIKFKKLMIISQVHTKQ